MDRNRKRELKLQYKEMKPQMGIYIVRSNADKKCFIEAAPNLKARMNSTKAKLAGGFHPNLELLKEWQEHGETYFIMEVLEYFEYDKDNELKTDYAEELTLLQMIWEEKLTKEGFTFYKKKI